MHTQRLVLRHGQLSDVPFILSLLNQPSFYRYIADKGIYTEQQAEQYIQQTFIDGHQQQGFGPYIVANKHGAAMGMVGLFQRDALAVPDLGFAFLEQYTQRGFAYEAAAKLLSVYQDKFNQIAAIADAENTASHGLLKKLGFGHIGKAVLNNDGTALVVFIRDSTN
ncbi:GNAT family N-acetyltransferase [Pseudoalteromonas sp.]|uniref:GNAT family N-acetyltransferase n=1 Tax=Pseudoalteromonas sp. TaxID=53249 RepID=UPI0030038B8D